MREIVKKWTSYIYEEYKRYTAQIRIFESRNLSNIENFPVLKRKFAVCYLQT